MSVLTSRRARAVLGAVALLVLAAAGPWLASASSLAVRSAGRAVVTAGAPCGGQVTVVPASSTSLALTLSDAACVGRTVGVTVLGGGGVLAQGSVVPTSTSAVVSVPAFTPTTTSSAVATVDGWALAALWVDGGQVVPGTPTTRIDGAPQWFTAPDGRSCVGVSVTTSTTPQTAWAVELLVTRPPFPGPGAAYAVVGGAGQVGIDPTAPAGVVRLVGKNGSETLKAGQLRTFSVCW